MLKRWIVGVAAVLMAANAWAQAPQPNETDQVKARQKISMMEGVLEHAVANGAENLLHRVRALMPTPDGPRLIGAPEVRGFTLPGFGVFFDVVVPDLMMPPAWSLRYMVDQNGMAAATALGELKTMVASVRDPEQRERLTAAINRLELQVGPAQVATPGPQPATAGPQPASARRTTTVSTQAIAPGVAGPDAAVLDDPNEGYTREVKSAIIDAMLDNSGAIPLGPDEWLTVAARGNVGPDRLSVTDNADTHTIMLRVKGSDLAAYRAGRVSIDDARKRVEIREY